MNPLNPLYYAVAWIIMHIHSVLGAVINPGSGLAWVLTIVVLTVLMRLIILPLFIKQMHATRKMAALAPQMQELRKKYKSDRQTLNEETMKLYRENGVNPLGGCLPLVAQLPLFFALFGVLHAISSWRLHNPAHHGLADPLPYGLTKGVILSAQKADIFGATISDKFLFAPPGVSGQAKAVIVCAVIVSVVTTFLTVRQTSKRGMTPGMTPDNPMAASQKYMTYIVPLFALSGLYWAFGLVLYWMTTNLWTLGQQYVLFKRYPGLTAAPAAAGGTGGSGGKGTGPGASGPAGAGRSSAAGGQAQRKKLPGGQAKSVGAPDGAAQSADGRAKPGGGQARPGGGGAKPGSQARPGSKAAAGQARPASPAGNRPAPKDQPEGANGTGLLRRLGRRREQQPAEPEKPEVKVIRQQRVRQSRSKRSGKR